MKKILMLVAVAAVAAACINGENSKKPAAPNPETPAATQVLAPVQSLLPETPAPQAHETKAPEATSQPVPAVPETQDAPTAAPAPAPEASAVQSSHSSEELLTVDALCRKLDIYNLLSKYESAVKSGDKKLAKVLKAEILAIGKSVKADLSLPETLRKHFVGYLEDKEQEIRERY